MKKIILDTNILIRDPSVLSKTQPNIQLIVLDVVLRELENISTSHKDLKQLPDLIMQSANKDIVSIESTATEIQNTFKRLSPKLSVVDALILSYAINQKQAGHEALIATEDRALIAQSLVFGVGALRHNELKAIYGTSSQENTDIAQQTKSIFKQQLVSFWVSIVAGVMSSVAASFSFSHFEKIILKINVWGTMFAIPAIAFFLFWYRSRHRISYGLTEIIFGTFISISVFLPNFDYSALDTFDLLKIVGGLYIIVRGLDNFGKGIKNTRFDATWNKIFNENC